MKRGGTEHGLPRIPGRARLDTLDMPRTPSRPAQIFEKHGAVEEVFIMRGGSRSGMACAFIRYAAQEMAQQAIDAIHGNITLPDATEPLVVRWADTPGSRGRDARGGRHGAPGKRSPSLGGADRRGAGAGGSYGVGMGSMLMQPNAYAYTPAYVPVPAPVQARSAPSSRIALCCLDARGDDALHRAMLACGAIIPGSLPSDGNIRSSIHADGHGRI